MAYCALILLGKSIQRLVFGELRPSERQHLKDKFGNFVFYKFIFVFGVLNVQYVDEVVLWWAWFTALGFLGLLSQLCKDRFVYVSTLIYKYNSFNFHLMFIYMLGFLFMFIYVHGIFAINCKRDGYSKGVLVQ